jgi:hypothetical protein
MKYYTTHEQWLSRGYIHRCKEVKSGFVDDDDFAITVEGKAHKSIAVRICSMLNKEVRRKKIKRRKYATKCK